jgi:hypothetical protein
MDAYRTGVAERADRAKQLKLLVALGAWDRALRRDDCGAWVIEGWCGHIASWSDTESGWVIYVAARSARAWSAVKKRMSFCRVTQDGDEEGCLRLDRFPTTEEAEILRETLRIRKRREVSAETLEHLRQHAFKPALNLGFSVQDAEEGLGRSQVAAEAA